VTYNEKHSSLLRYEVKHGRKSFVVQGSGVNTTRRGGLGVGFAPKSEQLNPFEI
jgi:hypothetical protein